MKIELEIDVESTASVKMTLESESYTDIAKIIAVLNEKFGVGNIH